MVATAESNEPVSARVRVWIVDDSALQAEICRAALADVYDVEVFLDGALMLEKLASTVAPDLLILDWRMPTLSGLEICQFIRKSRDAGTLPIVVLTVLGDEFLAEAFDAGANDFVRKPFSRTELLARVGALLRAKSSRDELARVERMLRIEADYRERFIGMLAHDLRQPLNTFVLASRAIGAALPAESGMGRPLEMQERASRRMARMVDQLLDFARSRPEDGMPVDRRAMDFAATVRAVVEELQVSAPSHRLALETVGDCKGFWDQDRIAQVCSNLIGNAIEHSSDPDSTIEVSVVRFPEHVELTVKNQGEPIHASLLPALFEPFRRGPSSGRRTSGVGLGLHIVHEIVKAHDGNVSARSDAEGTVFAVTLPME
ncbi:MAG TPA: HAMP domain-containing sensor histidine kinase [Polyangiaceae bacterium]|jgi:signal transduction histidine kinase|nr:HAMP domain-containing sensor histidine kinase [Polyangiaceae bacterium]